ncbi:AAA family ATPase [Neobacillus sp. PS3-12]|uniref:AAA family ATPase n=1 Tax=Neobacillus sp. PS3-12 TaxID=3070677 RepID=UPI0027E1FF68|nr:AAA family ATPase [Neobacillus sp. PS3-12]WML51502.1 AAA family ATPase [Neobacillus sp. PS3-12]
MKIISMHIYGFGQLENVKIENLADFQVFYGENEAGKSTIMAFIHGILFGFPTKQQTEYRYEPKHSSKYGGNIKIFSEDKGFVLIERVKGKTAAGDVSVTCENGVIGSEELLQELLLHVDKGLYQAIFSFNLNGLQNIHQMKGEEIGKFLFSAGMLGTDRLAQAEGGLQKGLDARFKPGGKKPLINEKLQELHSLNKELNAAAAKNKEYEVLVQQKNRQDHEMTEMQEKIKDIQTQVENLNEWKKVESFVKEENWTLNEINKLENVDFPNRGIQRLEALKPLLSSNKAQIVSLTTRIEHIKEEIEKLKPNLSMLEQESEILGALEQYPLYQQLKLQEKQTEIKLSQFEEKLSSIREKLHLRGDAEEVSSINTNMFMKDKAEQLSRKGQSLKERKIQLDHRFNEEKGSLELIEENIRTLQTKLLPDMERSELEKKVNDSLNSDKIEMKLESVRDKIELYKKAAQQEKKIEINLKRQKHILFLVLITLFLGLGIYGWASNQNLLAIIGGLGFIASMIFLAANLRKPIRKPNDNTLTKLLEEEQRLLQQARSVDFKKMAVLQEKLAQDQNFREQLQVMQVKYDQQMHQYDKVIKMFEEWELDTSQYKKQITEISRLLSISEEVAESYLVEAFQMIEQYKSIERERQQVLQSLHAAKSEQEEMLTRINQLGEQFLQEKNVETQELVYLLRNSLKMEQEKSVQWKEKQTKLADLEGDLNQLRQEGQQLESDFLLLLKDASVENEEAFYELGAKAEKKAKYLERLEDLEKQLHHSFLNKAERENYLQIHDCDENIAEHNREMEELRLRLKDLQEMQASIKYQIQILEEGGLYSVLLHDFKQKKYELEEAAKEWAVFSLAQTILMQTIEKYKNIHLPRMLSKADEYLSFLTEGNYRKILLHQSGPGFLIERKDGTIFEAYELSQATTEQVYVAIRIALATTLYEKFHLPIIIDDSFVNFDAKRTRKVISLLHQLKQNQILFFTCHQHLLELFTKDELLYLNNGATRHSIT